MSAAAANGTGKKGKGCLSGCLVAGGLVLVLLVVAGVFLYSQRGRIGRGIVSRITGGGVEVEAPENFRSVPLPLALTARDARSSAFTGEMGRTETRTHFVRSLSEKGWVAMEEDDAPVEAFSYLVDEDDAGMTMDFFRKGNEVLMLYVVGSGEGALAGMVALPEDADVLRRAAEQRERRARDADRREERPRRAVEPVP